MQSLTDSNGAQNYHAKNKLLFCLRYECFLSRYSTKTEDGLLKKEV